MLEPPDGFNFSAFSSAVSADGSTVVGKVANLPDDAIDPWFDNRSQAFRWTKDEGMVSLGLPEGAIESNAFEVSGDGSTVLVRAIFYDRRPGPCGVGDCPSGLYVWSEQTGYESLNSLPDYQGEQILSHSGIVMSDDGNTVVSNGVLSDSRRIGLVWERESGFQIIPMLERVEAMTPDGELVVGRMGSDTAFAWDQRNGTRDLRQVLLDEHGFSADVLPLLESAHDISADQKTILGSNRSSNGNLEYWTIFLDKPLNSVFGDFDGNGTVDVADINQLSAAVRAGRSEVLFDVNFDGIVNFDDREFWVGDLANTFMGDADLDQDVDFADFLSLSVGFGENGGWGQGDFDGDGETKFEDFLLLSENFGKTADLDVSEAASVPEPNNCLVLTLVLAVVTLNQRQRR